MNWAVAKVSLRGDSIFDQSLDTAFSVGIDPERRRAVMRGIREAEMSSGASRLITGDSIQPSQDLDDIKREWLKLDATGRREFNIWKKFNGDPDHDNTKIIDVVS